MQAYGKVIQKPVPRVLSSACGTCCVLEPSDPDFSFENIEDINYDKIYSIIVRKRLAFIRSGVLLKVRLICP